MPSGNGDLVEPERQVTAPLQPCFVLWPVPDPVPCPEALGAVWVKSEGHGRAIGLVEADPHLSGRAASSHLAAPTPRAVALASAATLSSRSRITASAGEVSALVTLRSESA